MSYFLNNKKYDKYVIDQATLKDIEADVTYVLPTIEILNNEKIDFELSNVNPYCSNLIIENKDSVEIIKIVADYGDGVVETHSQKLSISNKSIGEVLEKPWQNFSHIFDSNKKYVYKNKLDTSLPRITLTFVNSYNDRFYFEIPYRYLYKSVHDLGSEFTLIEANNTNRNRTSFSLREKSKNDIVLVTIKDKNNPLDTNIVEIKDPEIIIEKDDNYYVEDEEMIWDWSSLPEIDIKSLTTTGPDSSKNYNVTVSWTEKNTVLENIDIFAKRLGGNYEEFRVTDEDIVPPLTFPLSTGIYELIFRLKGINELTNDSKTIVQCQSRNPADSITYPSSPGFINATNITSKSFNLNYSLNTTTSIPITWDMITKADVVFTNTTNKSTYRYSIIPNKSTTKTTKADGTVVYTMTIFTATIPDGNYILKFEIDDICDNSSNFIKCGNTTLKEKSFTIKYNIGSISLPQGNSKLYTINNSSDVIFEWNFSGDADNFILTLNKTN